MTSTGGTQMAVPQNGAFSCSHCGMIFESASSLQVHMHYQHENQSRWGSPNTTSAPSSTTPTDTETNNNQPVGKHHIKAMSPLQNTIAAADSSDNNNPPTPTNQSNDSGTPHSFQSGGANSPFSHNSSTIPPPNDLHHHHSYPPYPSYELYYNMDYGQTPAHHHHQQEYKQIVPSSRYQTYNSNSNSQTTSTNPSVQIANNGLSPRVVSSTSPTQTTSASPSQNSNAHIMHIPPGQPTPSPSPKQCDKCGVVCETDGQLIEHSQVAHSDTVSNIKTENGEQQNYPPFPTTTHYNVKDEPTSDILDLDSQKMVYPHPDGALPPMHSLHPLQSMQRHPMMWGHHEAHHGFIPPHPSAYHQTIKPEYPPTPPMNATHMKAQINEYSPILPPTPVSMKQEYNHIKSEYNTSSALNQSNSLPPASSIGTKNFNSDINDSGNQLTTSPSDFPSTTTPQENGGQFHRSFEPPSSTLPVAKSSSWKSNEARRPKTYNCTACNKWFTSSGHLKRHYNTTLHKNAVKSSGQPDPATLPISAHHHPNRDPNYVGKRRSHHQRNQQQQQQQQQNQANNLANNQVSTTANQTQLQQPQQQNIPPEGATRSPDYQPQFSLPSFGTTTLQQGFQQYSSTNIHNAPGNGQAGPSVQVASQLRGLPMLSNSNLSLENQQAHLHQHQPPQLLEPQPISTIINSTQPQSTIMQSQVINSISNLTDQQFPLVINTSIPSYHITITEEQNYHNTIGNLRHTTSNDITTMQSPSDDEHQEQFTLLPSLHPHPGQYMTSYDQLLSRYTGGVAYNGDLPPFSPDIPEQYHSTAMTTTNSSYEEEMMPQSAVAPSSPSISTTHIQSALSMTNLSSTSSNISTTIAANVSKANKSSATSTTASNEYRCDLCDKVFNKSCYLTQHNKTFHCGEKPFKCQRCGKRFPCDASHEEHVAKHAGEKPFKCGQCPKSFNHKTDLRRHMCLHSGSKPYTCSQCGKGFIRKDHMVKHTETHTKKKSNGNKKLKGNKKRLSSISTLPDSSDSMQFIVSE